MSLCPNCGAQAPDGAVFCSNCGANLAAAAQAAAEQATFGQQQQQAYQQNFNQNFNQNYEQQFHQNQQQMYTKPATDHTDEFEADDISKNKVIAMAAYLLGTLGVIVALLAAPQSPYATFHSRQALKLAIVEAMVTIVTVVLFWTIIIPFAGVICMGIIWVLRIIGVFNVASGKAKEVPILSAFPFLK